MEREAGRWIGMGNTCKSVFLLIAVWLIYNISFRCTALWLNIFIDYASCKVVKKNNVFIFLYYRIYPVALSFFFFLFFFSPLIYFY